MIIRNKKRYSLGLEYVNISRKLYRYDMTPEFLWTRSDKEEVVELLEREAELDVDLEQYLISDGDEEGLKIFRQNQTYNALRLWNLKRDLTI